MNFEEAWMLDIDYEMMPPLPTLIRRNAHKEERETLEILTKKCEVIYESRECPVCLCEIE